MNYVLHEVQMSTWEGTILRGKQVNQCRDTLRSSVQTRLNRSRCRLGCGLAWAQSMGGPDPPREKAILVDRGAHCKVQALSAVSYAKTVEAIHLPFRLWTRVRLRVHMFNRIRQVAPMCPHGRTRCRHVSNNIEPSVYGGDAPYVKLFCPFVIFGHAHLHSRTDSQALRAEYCIVGIPHNTDI